MARKSPRINSSPFLKLFLIAAVVVISAGFLTYQKAGVLGTSTSNILPGDGGRSSKILVKNPKETYKCLSKTYANVDFSWDKLTGATEYIVLYAVIGSNTGYFWYTPGTADPKGRLHLVKKIYVNGYSRLKWSVSAEGKNSFEINPPYTPFAVNCK